MMDNAVRKPSIVNYQYQLSIKILKLCLKI